MLNPPDSNASELPGLYSRRSKPQFSLRSVQAPDLRLVHPLPLHYHKSIEKSFHTFAKQNLNYSKLWDRYNRFIKDALESASPMYSSASATLFLSVFSKDLLYLYYDSLTRLSQYRVSAAKLGAFISLRNNAERALRLQKTTAPADFQCDALWFATFSNPPDAKIFSGLSNETVSAVLRKEASLSYRGLTYAGSLYFDVGRIRLIHAGGPAIEPYKSLSRYITFCYIEDGKYKITPLKTKLKKFDRDETFLAYAMKQWTNDLPQKNALAVLIEYLNKKKIHLSRGFPKKMDALTNKDLSGIYWLVHRIGECCPSNGDPCRTRPGNIILYDYIIKNAHLYNTLGFHTVSQTEFAQFF